MPSAASSITVNRGRKTEFATKAIIRYMVDSQLRVGDKLPSLEQLARQLGISNTTVTRAIHALREDGFLTVRDKSGVFLKNDKFDGLTGRTVALTTVNVDFSPYYACLAQLLQARLLEARCSPVIYPRRPIESVDVYGLADFPGLESAIKDRRIDGVLDMSRLHGEALQFLHSHQIPITSMSANFLSNGIIIDLLDYCRRALAYLIEEGSKRPAILCGPGLISKYIRPEYEYVLEQNSISINPGEYYFVVDDIDQGRYVADKVLNMPEKLRPDSFVFIDEYVGNDFLAGLIYREYNKSKKYQPAIAAQRTRQLPLPMPWPDIVFFEKDLEVIADMAINHLMQQLRNEPLEAPVQYYRCKELPRSEFLPSHL